MQLTEQQNGPEHFDASPVVTVDVLGHSLSITQALDYSKALVDHVEALLLPENGWRWDHGWLGTHKVHRLLAPDAAWWNDAGWVGVPLHDGELFEAWVSRGHELSEMGDRKLSERVGLTNDLNDAKWMVAEAIRVRRAGQNVEDPPGVG